MAIAVHANLVHSFTSAYNDVTMKDNAQQTRDDRKAFIRALVEKDLPEFKKACERDEGEAIVMHQDAFAADFQLSELFLLGAAIKYAGMHGREVIFVGSGSS